jgi:Chromo (CHRromatin Organisation MOdifier) domain
MSFSVLHQPPAIVLPNTEQEEYEVENILDKRTLRKKPQYLIKWLGYPLHDATWEPLENLGNAREKVKEYEETRTSLS